MNCEKTERKNNHLTKIKIDNNLPTTDYNK